MQTRKYKYPFLIAALLVMATAFVKPQDPPQKERSRFASQTAVKQKKEIQLDSVQIARRDSVMRADSLYRADSLAMMKHSSLAATAFSFARDSIVENFENGKRMIHYYGDVKVEYQNMKLTAERMDYDVSTGTVHAYGVYDSLAMVWKGRPVMQEGNKTYNMEDLRYNFDTRKARLTNMITTQEDGILHGKNIKMMEDKSINITNGKYTVCDHPNPHYYMKLTAAKVITDPSRKIVFGPAYLVVEDVNLYPIMLPFGFVPDRPKRASGILFPTFGEETARGFYMKDLGMYFVFGDYFDLSVTTDIFTLGSWALDINSRYKVNYKFNGSFTMNYSDDKTGEKGSADFAESKNFGIRWSHSQDSKSHPGTTFSASVNFSSPSNSRYNSRSVEQALQNQASSSISFSKSFGGKATLSLNALHSQNSRDSSYAFTLPNLTFSVATFYPFKRKVRVGKERFYEKISFAYNTTLQNKINFKASEFALDSAFFAKFQNGMTHSFNIGLPSFSLFKYITVSPSVSYGQNWFFRSQEARYDADQDKVVMDEKPAFSTLGITQTYSGAISMSTRIYGMFNFGRYGGLQAIRHVVSPSLSMSFSPDLATYANGYRTLKYTDANGEQKSYDYNIYSGQLYSPPGGGKSATASFSIGNNLEAKVRDYADTTGTGTKKVKLIDQLSIRSGYNFLADSLNMNTISMSMSTSIFGKISISGSANFDPYAMNERGRKYNAWAITKGQGLARFTNASASLSYSISGKGAMNGNDGRGEAGGGGGDSPADYYKRIYTHPYTGEYIPGGWLYYTNPNVPWSANFSYTLSCNRSWAYDNTLQRLNEKNTITQTLRFNGNIKLTPRLSINASSGYDFQAKELTTTQMSATYDLHCFNISVSWVPTGNWQSYSFRIQANAAALADLLRFKKSSSYWDN